MGQPASRPDFIVRITAGGVSSGQIGVLCALYLQAILKVDTRRRVSSSPPRSCGMPLFVVMGALSDRFGGSTS
jgi:hypothetical protein